MDEFRRLARIDDAADDGRFRMVLASSGEASDGHILDIAGGQVPERIPLLLSHENDPRSQIGSITEARKGDGRLMATGNIELTGTGPLADIRRDVHHMIRTGHLGAVSVRWQPIEMTPRSELKPSHPAYAAADSPARHGYYFKRWRALEGSVVAVGADPAAVIARAEQTTGDVSRFWRDLARAFDASDSAPTGRGVSPEELSAALARIEQLEERVAALTVPARDEAPAAPEQRAEAPRIDARAQIAERTLRAEIAAYEQRLEERIRAYMRETFGRIM